MLGRITLLTLTYRKSRDNCYYKNVNISIIIYLFISNVERHKYYIIVYGLDINYYYIRKLILPKAIQIDIRI
jgi:hypothetical protein